jgi:hypothetical protein
MIEGSGKGLTVLASLFEWIRESGDLTNLTARK